MREYYKVDFKSFNNQIRTKNV